MVRSNLKELMTVLEEIRSTQYPDIPAEIIEQIVVAQFENQDDRVQARTKTLKIISDYMQSVTHSTGEED